MIKNIKNFNFTKMIGILSGLFLLSLSIGLLVVKKDIRNTNYALNDTTEKIRFENLLTEQAIPFEKISDNVYSVDKEWSKKVDDIFQSINE
ncbi:hypothetical protein [Catenibacterium mitsuokai]|jgi:hypothetical protein|uniref:hypothetical protein n=1 Tax=Catenibacterium mitsuokai TaxID=100886 RepID=UPI0022E1959D|nr:hypothetical protein [Catenibacterium mitsuokai]